MITTRLPTPSEPTSLLSRKVVANISLATVLLLAVIALSAALHFANVSSLGTSNQYYTAAVESMTQSWHNFFFVAAEPGGSVTVDKPPLGLWIETVFALVLGVSGFSTSLPNMLAGIFSVPLLFHLVKKYLGEAAGLVAALVMAVTPVVFAADRNNTMDGMLVFVLLLAAWAFIKATETGKLRHLLLGAFIVGLGFNIKMMQAFLPVPTFYALYFFSARLGWGRKLIQLGLATVLLGAVSLSWAVAVDLTPVSARPYIGSSTNNTVMELIIGHNGLARLFGPGAVRGQNNVPAIPPTQDNTNTILDDGPQRGGTFQNEIGTASAIRFFIMPLAKEMSWLLPLGLIGVVLALFVEKVRLPIESDLHKALVLWGGWLITCVVFFSIAGLFHAYYMIMLVPALGGAIAIGGVALRKLKKTHPRRAAIVLIAASIGTLGFQLYLAAVALSVMVWWLILPVAGLIAGAVMLFGAAKQAEGSLNRVAYAVILLALIIIPLGWSVLTVFDARASAALPSAYSGNMDQTGPLRFAPQNGPRPRLQNGNAPIGLPPQGLQQPPMGVQPGSAGPNNGPDGQVNQAMLAYLQAHTTDTKYLVAVVSAQVGAPLVIQTGRPVLYMGGFNGGDRVLDAAGLAALVAKHELRYVLWGSNSGLNNGNANIGSWLQQNCSVISGFDDATVTQPDGGVNQGQTLYVCGDS